MHYGMISLSSSVINFLLLKSTILGLKGQIFIHAS